MTTKYGLINLRVHTTIRILVQFFKVVRFRTTCSKKLLSELGIAKSA